MMLYAEDIKVSLLCTILVAGRDPEEDEKCIDFTTAQQVGWFYLVIIINVAEIIWFCHC